MTAIPGTLVWKHRLDDFEQVDWPKERIDEHNEITFQTLEEMQRWLQAELEVDGVMTVGSETSITGLHFGVGLHKEGYFIIPLDHDYDLMWKDYPDVDEHLNRPDVYFTTLAEAITYANEWHDEITRAMESFQKNYFSDDEGL